MLNHGATSHGVWPKNKNFQSRPSDFFYLIGKVSKESSNLGRRDWFISF